MSVKNEQEAMDFFLSNSSGTVMCEANGKSKEATCYPEAVEFFKEAAEE